MLLALEKILDKVVYSQILEHVTERRLICDFQSSLEETIAVRRTYNMIKIIEKKLLTLQQ